MESTASAHSLRRTTRRQALGRAWLPPALVAVLCLSASAAMQFDVFVGYDGVVPQASWFPISCEIKNDGPSFSGTVEVRAGTLGEGATRKLPIELPTGTLKRVLIPVFAGAQGFNSWDVILRDERDRVRAEQPGLRARTQPGPETIVLGALSRSPGSAPIIRRTLRPQSELEPSVARLLPALFPDNPLVMEGLTALYLNSERAADLSAPQVQALLAWLHAGGHLIVALEQPGDIAASPWLDEIFPVQVEKLVQVASHPELQQWLKRDDWPRALNTGVVVDRPGRKVPAANRSRPAVPGRLEKSNPFSDLEEDMAFEIAQLQVGSGRLRGGRVILETGNLPLIVEANRGRGRVTALLFSPEREPARSWKQLPVFWARLAGVPADLYASSDYTRSGGWSSDGLFGAMLDSRQVHKLPLPWLLLLLCLYLAVIGPVDYFWLKRIRRPMLTWVTFPCYVFGFSAVIYLIGYKLRAGDSELNQLHIVDVFPRGAQAELRGRTYASIYAPANQRHTLEGSEQFATLRGEFQTLWGRGHGEDRCVVEQVGNGFRAQVSVPIWTSLLFVADWWEPASVPLKVQATRDASGWSGVVENRTGKTLTQVRFVTAEGIATLDDVPPGSSRQFHAPDPPTLTRPVFLSSRLSRFQTAVQTRQYAFGGDNASRLDDLPGSALAVSLLGSGGAPRVDSIQGFVLPPGLDVTPVIERGVPMVFAWSEGSPGIKPMYRYTPLRSGQYTLWRCSVETK